MSELERQSPADDPIASLHKMSMTAGVAAQDYVAINNLAVITAVLGVGTAMAFIHWFFLLVGVAGIAAGIIALRQIRNSNGTQGGAGLAWIGMAMSLVIAGGVGASALRTELRMRARQAEVTAVVNEFGQKIMADQFEQAYAMCDPAFQMVFPLDQFIQTWKTQRDHPDLGGGKVLEMSGNGLVEFSEQADGSAVAFTTIVVRSEKWPNPWRITTGLSQAAVGGRWTIVTLKEMFRPPQKPRQQG